MLIRNQLRSWKIAISRPPLVPLHQYFERLAPTSTSPIARLTSASCSGVHSGASGVNDFPDLGQMRSSSNTMGLTYLS